MAQVEEIFVRELDSFEEFFWQLEQVAPVGNIAGAEISGTAASSAWEGAWANLQRMHPALGFSIRKQSNKRPYFVDTGRSSSIRRLEAADQPLATHMEGELQTSFGHGDGSLARLSIVPQEQRTFVVLIVHHALLDGVSILVLLQDLLALMNSEEVQPGLPGWPSLRTVVGLPARPGYRSMKALDEPTGSSSTSADASPTLLHVSHMDFSETESSALLAAARAHQTSVQGVLLAGVALAGAAINQEWDVAPVSSNTAHNARPKDNRAFLGMITTAIVTKIDVSADRDFWEIARDARADTLAGQTEEGHRRFVETMDELTAEERSPLEFVMTLPQSPIAYEMMVTNYAEHSPRTAFGPLHLTSLLTSVNGGPAIGTLGVCTLGGRLGITLISQDPSSRLLDSLRAALPPLEDNAK